MVKNYQIETARRTSFLSVPFLDSTSGPITAIMRQKSLGSLTQYARCFALHLNGTVLGPLQFATHPSRSRLSHRLVAQLFFDRFRRKSEFELL
jgi:hypothetical protein